MIENYMVVNLDEAINMAYEGYSDRCDNCSDVILIEHVWNDKIVCSDCYYQFKDGQIEI